MRRRTPRLEIFPDRLAANARAVLQACRRHGARVACVTKVACAHPAVARGFRRRAILDLGRQDVVVDGLQPELPGVQVLGGSSDHLILDVEDAGAEVAPGVELGFLPSYGALLALSASPYVQKVVVAG